MPGGLYIKLTTKNRTPDECGVIGGLYRDPFARSPVAHNYE